MSLIDDEEWKDIWGFPKYRISSWGRVLSTMRNPDIGTTKIHVGKYKDKYHQSSLQRNKELTITHPISYYHKISEGWTTKDSPTTYRIQIPTHKLVMWHFRHIDNHPEDIGILMTEWLSLSHRVKELVTNGIQINHIDHDHKNNTLSKGKPGLDVIKVSNFS